MDELSLPPNVVGKTKANLFLTIDNIFWRTSKVFNDVKIIVKWWGERSGNSIENIKIHEKKKSITNANLLYTLKYQVKTNHTLFLSYLEHSEVITFQIFSTKTQDFIGSAKLEFPIAFLGVQEGHEQSFKRVARIFSTRQFNLGDLEVSIKYSPLAPTMTQKISSKPQPKLKTVDLVKVKKIQSKSQDITHEKDSNKENIEVIGVRKVMSARDQIPLKPSTLLRKNQTRPSSSSSQEIRKSSLEKFLSGVPMSEREEKIALSELTTQSPAKGLINFLESSKVDDLLRITVLMVEFNAAGQIQMQNFLSKYPRGKFIVKCVATSKIFISTTDQDAKFISPVFESTPTKLTLGKKQIIQQIRLSPDDDEHHLKSYINFGFCLINISNFQTVPKHFLGFSRLSFSDVLINDGSLNKKYSIIDEMKQKIGSISVKLELQSKMTNYGPVQQAKKVSFANQIVQTTSCPSSSSNSCQTDESHENKSIQTEQQQQRKIENRQTDKVRDEQEKDSEMIDVDKLRNQQIKSKVYSGLLFIENLRNVKESNSSEFFITYEGFWNECQESTNSAVNFIFNYLKLFPVICENDFLQRVQNNHLELKLWERNGGAEKWIASTKIPLHQFYVAFQSPAMIEHLSNNRLPIISMDSFANFISPLSSELFCQGKVLLAIGTENQIEYLKITRKLYDLQVPAMIENCEVVNEPPKIDPNAEMKNRLKAFIDSFSQNIPDQNMKKIPTAPLPLPTEPKLRKTSELLDTLQKALQQPPPANFQLPMPIRTINPQPHLQNESEMDSQNSNSLLIDKTNILVTIEHASHLPMVIVKRKANRKRNKANPVTPQKMEFEPSSYVTFESALAVANENRLPERVVKSHEGFVHCTKIIKGCDPQWDENFDVQLPVDMLTNPQKRFVVKIWRKQNDNSEMIPTPFNDPVIGFTAVDLSVLLTGLPLLSGYYNIMDFSGRCHGQVKLSFRPKENLTQFQDSSVSLSPPIMNPLSIDCSSSDDGSTVLSRTLKRKFTELEEITQRLKARLFDVTGDENFDPDDEFENDLNTEVDEKDEEMPGGEDFAWLQHSKFDFNKILDPQPSTSKDAHGSSPSTNPTPRQVTGRSSDASQPMGIDDLLKKYDLDTIINPNIFQNILDPTLANSDSTPSLIPKPVEKTDEVASGGESCDTTISSILSLDQMQVIQKALQKTSLDDSTLKRKDPDGENHISE